MGKRNRSNVLLVEILIAVLFFMLSATVLIQVFASSRNMTVKAGVQTKALAQAQNVADLLVASADPASALGDAGFLSAHGVWTRDDGEYTLYVEGGMTETEAGELWEGSVRAFQKKRNTGEARPQDEELFSLPWASYREVSA